jgi:hypothetical protein
LWAVALHYIRYRSSISSETRMNPKATDSVAQQAVNT